MHTDPQYFEKEILPNGIEFLCHKHESPVCYMDIFIPIGSANTGEGLLTPGSPHFLEHALFLQSKNHPEPHGFELELALRGCERSGTTYPFCTRYEMACPLTELSFASNALFETVYEPVFTEKILKIERGVVQNERDQRKRYFPGRNRVNQYMNTEFRKSNWLTLEQVFGTNKHLSSLTPQALSKLHEEYSLDTTRVLAVGNSDFSELKKLIGNLKTHSKQFERRVTPSTWENPTFRFVELEGVKHPNYMSSWIRPPLAYDSYIALLFFLKYLVNHVHGPLYEEYRKAKGWTYSVDYFCEASHLETLYGFDISLQDKEQIEAVRATLHTLAKKGVEDQEKVEKEIHRRLAFEAFGYQTSYDIMSSAHYDILNEGDIVTNETWKTAVGRLQDPAWRLEQFNALFSEESWGELGLMPENEA